MRYVGQAGGGGTRGSRKGAMSALLSDSPKPLAREEAPPPEGPLLLPPFLLATLSFWHVLRQRTAAQCFNDD